MEQPWLTEPDFAKWRDPETGLMCAIARHKEMKHLCGYVKIPVGKMRQKLVSRRNKPGVHFSLTGRTYRQYGYDHSLLRHIEVHGGLTFSGRFKEYRLSRGYWIGFDCAHAYDFIPRMHILLTSLGKQFNEFRLQDIYRDFAYVKAEVTDLARQVAKIAER